MKNEKRTQNLFTFVFMKQIKGLSNQFVKIHYLFIYKQTFGHQSEGY